MEGRKKHKGAAELPLDLIFHELLPWLPIKSLIRFMCVSKSWFSFLKKPEFASMHLSRMNKNIIFSDPRHQKLLYLYVYPMISFYALDYEEEKSVTIACDFPLIDPVKALCSCNGMVCVAISPPKASDINNLVLWNPSIGDYKKIPYMPGFDIYHHGWGFYYDEAVKDYKILHFSKLGKAHMYSLKSDSWRTVKGVDGTNFIFSSVDAVLVNGYLYWTVRIFMNDNICNAVLLSFDLNNEKFAMMPLPKVPSNQVCYTRLAIHQERLYLFIMDYSFNEIEMWRMNVGKKEVWESIATSILTKVSEPICLLSNGKVLMHQCREYGGILLLYDPINHMIEHDFQIDNKTKWWNRQWMPYKQTLVSPNSIG